MTRIALDTRDLRTASAVLVGAALIVPVVPGHEAIACPLRTLTGVPCPLCGMTTSVTNTVRLDLGDAIAANPAGVIAVIVALAILVLRPRRLELPPAVVPLALAGMWVWELLRFSVI